MRINELIIENNDISEGIGSSIAKGVGGIARGVGAVAGGAAGAWDAAKQGYAAGKAAVSGRPNQNNTNQQAATGTPATDNPAAPGTAPSSSAAPGTAPSSSAAPGTAPSSSAAPAATSGMKAAEIVQDLDTVWSKATADQASQTSSPQVQQKIRAIAKQAGMAGQVVETKGTVGHHSRFLGMTI